VRLLLLIGAALAGVLLFLLATASANTALFARHYSLLLGLNAALAALLAALVAWQLVLLVRRYRQREFGSRLRLRLLVMLGLMALLPGAMVYFVSVQFLARSIESWFDVKVDAALEGAKFLGQSSIDQMLDDLQSKGRSIGHELADRTVAQQVVLLNRLREQAGVQDAVLLTASGRVLASASADVTRLVPELPTSQMLREARVARGYNAVDAPAGKRLALRVIVPLAGPIGEEGRYLQLRQSVPELFGSSVEAVEAAYRDYRELALSRQELKLIYIVTLTLALFMTLFVAIALAVILARRLSEPLANLSQATQAVARGDFSRQTPVTSRDEFGVLTESFNSMTRQLDEARQVVEANRSALETAKARLENILANLTAGVLVFDPQLALSIANHGARGILGAALDACAGVQLDQWPETLQSFAALVREQLLAARNDKPWQIEFELKGTGKTLLARGAALGLASGTVVVFDDITHLIQAQRATAWAEVARRLAHEIKNPLTPIQLSAERLESKLAGKLSPEDSEVLRRGTQTIVNQVTALKAMANDFRDYARLPAPHPVRMDLNALVGEVLALYEHSDVPIRARLASQLPAVWADATQIRQVLHNLLQNAQDALAQPRAARREPAIEVRTELVSDKVRFSVSDNGDGFPAELMTRIFEPYVTTKPRGTGLGLAIVKKIVDEHRGSISIENHPAEGASVSVFLPQAKAA
jgi:nitrogen fixation/metabolism regulation signal transduction histidine kinase